MKKIFFILGLLTLSLSLNRVQADMFLGEFVDHSDDSPITSEGALREPQLPTIADTIIYGNHKGYLSQPTNIDTKSGLIVIHEWWGLNEDIHLMTNQLAGLGYIAESLYKNKIDFNGLIAS